MIIIILCSTIATYLFVSLQLRGGIVEEDLFQLLLFLQVKEGQLSSQVMTHHLQVVLSICTLLPSLRKGEGNDIREGGREGGEKDSGQRWIGGREEREKGRAK